MPAPRTTPVMRWSSASCHETRLNPSPRSHGVAPAGEIGRADERATDMLAWLGRMEGATARVCRPLPPPARPPGAPAWPRDFGGERIRLLRTWHVRSRPAAPRAGARHVPAEPGLDERH